MGVKRILTMLDTHLDTRAATVARLSQDAAITLLDSDDYWLRENDDWSGMTKGLITNEQFAKAYAERGGENTHATLQASVRSGIVPFILRLLVDDHVNHLNQMADPEDQVGLVVNHWPYVLSSNEVEAIREIMHELYGRTTSIELIDIPMSELTPNFLNENFAAAVMYEFNEWIKTHTAALDKIRINCFNFIGPKIFEADVSTLTVEAKKQAINAFRMQKLIHMDFEFIDAKYFSVFNVHGGDRPDFPDE